MDIFEKALASNKSTIIHGRFGRYPSLVQFYLDAFPGLEPVSEFELIFRYRGSHLYILMEPTFDAILPSDKWFIALTSHLCLRWNPATTDLVIDPLFSKKPTEPIPECKDEQEIVFTPSSHVCPYLEYVKPEQPVRLDLSSVEDIHEAYLRLLTFLDLSPKIWSLSMKRDLRMDLAKKIGNVELSNILG